MKQVTDVDDTSSNRGRFNRMAGVCRKRVPRKSRAARPECTVSHFSFCPPKLTITRLLTSYGPSALCLASLLLTAVVRGDEQSPGKPQDLFRSEPWLIPNAADSTAESTSGSTARLSRTASYPGNAVMAEPQIEYPIVPTPPGQHGAFSYPDEYFGDSEIRYGAGNANTVMRDEKPKSVTRFRNGPFQGVQAAFGTVGGGTGDEYLNNDHVMISSGVAIPLGSMENVLMISPSFRTDFLRFSEGTDLPDFLYETGVRFFWKKPVSENITSIVAVTPSIRSDFTTTDRAFRIFGLAMLTWEKIPDELSFSAGFVYLDRSDLAAIPAVGMIWKPTTDWKIDISFPQPRISRCLSRNGCVSESWAYLAGGFGGNTWAVTRLNGTTDELTLSDLRLFVGYEKLLAENRGWFVEAGWVFNRSVEYSQTAFTQDYSDALLLRGGVSF